MATKLRCDLTDEDVHALNASAFAGNDLEPFVGRMIDPSVLDRVVQIGLVEAGPSCRPAVGGTGYRLTSAGWVKFHRLRAIAGTAGSPIPSLKIPT